MKGMSSFAALSVLCAALGGCNPFAPMACTQIGCSSGLRVELEGTPTGTFTVTATADGATESVLCDDVATCDLFFEDFTPAQVTVSYESDDQQVERTFTPSYTRSRPNGEHCPPECLQGTVLLALP